MTCTECFAQVRSEDSVMHDRWHQHLDSMFDISVGAKP